MNDPLTPFLDHQGVLILDGGLATELERRGEDLADPLWSAKTLVERPEVVRAVHEEYLLAGADCIASASYQATFEGLARRGLSWSEAEALLLDSVTLAREARDGFQETIGTASGRLRPLVAASVGPYGAFLADGGEYRGDYDLDVAALKEFHAPRLAILANAGADLLAFETVPSFDEAVAIVELLEASAGIPGWISFTCRDEEHISDGTPLRDVLSEIEPCERLLAVGVNCTPPELISPLLRGIRGATEKPLVVYPNSGESWDAVAKAWIDEPSATRLEDQAAEWHALGARLIGGCCRTTPETISRIRGRLIPDG
jgi:homocysteine S-methyltransferase